MCGIYYMMIDTETRDHPPAENQHFMSQFLEFIFFLFHVGVIPRRSNNTLKSRSKISAVFINYARYSSYRPRPYFDCNMYSLSSPGKISVGSLGSKYAHKRGRTPLATKCRYL